MRSSLRPAFVVLASAMLLVSCRPADGGTVAESSAPRQPSPGYSVAVIQQFTANNNQFALDLYQQLGTQAGNLVFSPYSLSSALAMTYAGARNETESQMAAAMYYGLPQEQLHPAFNQLDHVLMSPGERTADGAQSLIISIANSVWADAGLPVLQEYLDTMAGSYGAGVRLTDFAGAVDEARREINSWVSRQTENRIRDLVPEGALEASTRMVLVNAIYFKADWEDPFDAADTHAVPFHRLDGTAVDVQMMHAHPTGARYAAGAGVQALQLPYAGATAAMTILVPDEGNFVDWSDQLTAEQLAEIMSTTAPASVQLGLPKFSFSSAFDMGQQLSALGMPDAFDRERADFSGITGGPDLYIDKVFHQAFVAVDEKGTEAAAATSVIMGPTSAMLPNLVLIVDRPFLFVISDLRTGQILFLERVADPTL